MQCLITKYKYNITIRYKINLDVAWLHAVDAKNNRFYINASYIMNTINNNLVNYNMNNYNGIGNKHDTVITNVVHELNNLKIFTEQ